MRNADGFTDRTVDCAGESALVLLLGEGDKILAHLHRADGAREAHQLDLEHLPALLGVAARSLPHRLLLCEHSVELRMRDARDPRGISVHTGGMSMDQVRKFEALPWGRLPVHVCMCACVYMCMCTCVHVCMCACVQV